MGHLPIVRIVHVQGKIHGTQECFQQHLRRVGILLSEVHTWHLPKAADRATDGRDTEKAELDIDVPEGLRARRGEAQMCSPAQLAWQSEELGADAQPPRVPRSRALQLRQQLLSIQAAGVIWRSGQDYLNLGMRFEQCARQHRNVVDTLLLHPPADKDQNPGVGILVQPAVRLKLLHRREALLLQSVDAGPALIIGWVRGVVQRHDGRQAIEQWTLSFQLGCVIGGNGANALARLGLLNVGDASSQHVKAALEHGVTADG
mmetsp:Transcript_28196/g.81699  ORF Transcript_28196/g.81699 Transcript_28196/m.81699 type:complete len:260 (+) Transcript_28196:2582-3361(+)